MKTPAEYYAESYGVPEGDNARALGVHDYFEIIKLMESFAKERAVEFARWIKEDEMTGDLKDEYLKLYNEFMDETDNS